MYENFWLRRFFFSSFGICLLTAVLFCVPGQQALAAEPQYGGTLTVGMEMEPRGFDPIEASRIGSRARSYMMAIEERLFDIDDKGNITPELALSATPSADEKTWTIKLRQGVSFHDGTPFNADAVATHWQRMLNPKNKFRGRGAIQTIVSVSKVDDFTVSFELKHPWAEFLPLLTTPAGISSFVPSPKAVAEKTQNRAPVGTGPFMFKEWLTGDRLVVVKNPNYWRKGQPYLDQVIYRTMPDMQTRYASLQSGEVDLIYTDMGKDILAARKESSLQVWASDQNGAGIFYLNTSKPPFDDVRVRRAVAHAWNQEQYIKTIHRGVHPVVKDPFGVASTCGNVGYREPDLAVARQLIKEYGKPVEFEYLHTSTPRGREAGAIIPQMFKEIGATVKSIPVGVGQMVRSVFKREYQMSGWSLWDSPAMGLVLASNFHSKSRGNRSHYKNPELDKLLDIQRTSTDPKVRSEAFCGIAKIINEDVPLLYRLGWRHHLIGKKSVQGVNDYNYAALKVNAAWLGSNLQASK
ncbi:MAG: ABC transporter substrate-binding protein [Proteobacteria bacterium]|nr:ABC transporter substrate-binding protein [Pseudomonadota bacterium]